LLNKIEILANRAPELNCLFYTESCWYHLHKQRQ